MYGRTARLAELPLTPARRGMITVRHSVMGVIEKTFFRMALTSPFFPNTLGSSQDEAILLSTDSWFAILDLYSSMAVSCFYS